MVTILKKARTTITPELRAEVIKARKNGLLRKDISARFKLSFTAIDRIMRGDRERGERPHPSGPNTKAYADGSVELADIEARIAELKNRAKDIRSRKYARVRLQGFCTRNGFTRADLYAVANELPLLRISRQHREARAKKEASG